MCICHEKQRISTMSYASSSLLAGKSIGWRDQVHALNILYNTRCALPTSGLLSCKADKPGEDLRSIGSCETQERDIHRLMGHWNLPWMTQPHPRKLGHLWQRWDAECKSSWPARLFWCCFCRVCLAGRSVSLWKYEGQLQHCVLISNWEQSWATHTCIYKELLDFHCSRIQFRLGQSMKCNLPRPCLWPANGDRTLHSAATEQISGLPGQDYAIYRFDLAWGNILCSVQYIMYIQ